MKRKRLSIVLLSWFLIVLLSCAFSIDGVSTNDLNFTFENNILYSENYPEFDEIFNVANYTEYTGYYNATYSFENEAVGTSGTDIDFIDDIDVTGNAKAEIIESFNNHEKVINFTAGVGSGFFTNDFSLQEGIGDIELWFNVDSITGSVYTYFYGYDSNDVLAIRMYLLGDDLLYKDSVGTPHFIKSNFFEPNVWYHLRINFNVINDIDEFEVYVNGLLELSNGDMSNSVNNLTSFKWGKYHATEITEVRLDAIGYSWDGYNATYSFTNDTNGSEPLGWVSNEWGGTGTIEVINNYLDHYKCVEIYDNDGSSSLNVYNTFTSRESGSIEFFIRGSDVTKTSEIRLYDSGTLVIYLKIDNNNLLENSEGWANIAGVSSNTWYHVRIDFECNNGNYENLSQDTCYIYINGVKYGAYDFYAVGNFINKVQFNSGSPDSVYYSTIDAIGYSWDEYYEIGDNLIHYSIGDNIVPLLETNESVQVIDTYSFQFTEDGVYSNYINPLPFFTGIGDSYYTDSGKIKVDGDEDEDIGFYKDFSILDGIIEITFNISWFRFEYGTGNYYIEVKSYDSTSIVKLRFQSYNDLPHTTTVLSYYDGSSYNNITTVFYYYDQQDGADMNLKIYIDSFVILYNNTDILDMFNLISNKAGLSQIKFNGNPNDQLAWANDYIWFESVGIYINGSSISNDYMSLRINTNLTWDSNEYPIFKSKINTINCSITANSDVSGTADNAVLYSSYNYTTEQMNFVYGEFTGGTEVPPEWYLLRDFYFVFTSNESMEIEFLSVESVELSENGNSYFMDFSFDNVDANNSFFYVDSSNRLQFSLTVNDDNLEYIQAIFDIQNVASENRSLSFRSNIDGTGEGEFRVNYLDTSYSGLNFPYYSSTTTLILPQTKVIEQFTLLITDNDLANNTIVSGVISNIRLIYYPDLAITITTLNLLGILVPLIIMIAPPLALNKKFGSGVILPMFLLMSLICVLTGLIPVWLFFIIAFSSIGFLIMKKKVEVAI